MYYVSVWLLICSRICVACLSLYLSDTHFPPVGPPPVPAPVDAVVLGGYHSAYLRNGTWYVAGSNEAGQVGMDIYAPRKYVDTTPLLLQTGGQLLTIVRVWLSQRQVTANYSIASPHVGFKFNSILHFALNFKLNI